MEKENIQIRNIREGEEKKKEVNPFFTEQQKDYLYTSKLEEIHQFADGSMLEVRKHETHAGQGAVNTYIEKNINAKVKSISGKKGQNQMDKAKKKLAELRRKGNMKAFILNGKVIENTITEKDSMLEKMDFYFSPKEMKEAIDRLNPLDEIDRYRRIRMARQLKEMYTTDLIETNEEKRRELEAEYGEFCEYILEEEKGFFISQMSKEDTQDIKIQRLRRTAGRLFNKEEGAFYYSTKEAKDPKARSAAREEYQKDEAYYDYIALLKTTEKQKAINALGINKDDKQEMEKFEDRYNALGVYHLHRAKEYNRKIDLVKWFQEAKDSNSNPIFLSDEPIYKDKPMKPLT